MLKQSLQQKLLQKMSPQQIQLMKLLQLPTIALEQRIKEEIEQNPALEDSSDSNDDDADDNYDNRQPVLILVCHLIPHCSVITMHLLVAFQGLDQKLQLNNDKFRAQERI